MKRLPLTLACLLVTAEAACVGRPVDETEDDGDDTAELLRWSGGYTSIDRMGGGMKQAHRFILDPSGSMLYEVEDCHDLFAQKAGRWELAADDSTVTLLNAAGTAPFSFLNGVEDGEVPLHMVRVVEDGECTFHVKDSKGVSIRFDRGARCLVEDWNLCLDEDLELATTWCDGEPTALPACP